MQAWRIGLIAIVLSGAMPQPGRAQATPAATAIAGRWYGTSTCVDQQKYPACRHERVRYDFHRDSAGGPGLVVSADKVVAGAWEPMGDIACVPTTAAPVEWACEFTMPRVRGVFTFRPAGTAMTGTLTGLPSRDLIRRIAARRDSAEGFRLPLP